MKAVWILLKKKARGIILRVLLTFIVTVISMTMVELFAFSHYYKYQVFSSSNEQALLFDGETEYNNTIIYCDNNVLCYLDETANDPINAEVCMQKDINTELSNYITTLYAEQLQENEIVLSESICKKYAIEKHDKLYLDLGYSVHKIEYYVKDIVSDIPSIFGTADRYVVLIGYSQTYCENVSYQTVVFYDGHMGDLIFGTNFVKHISLKEEARKEFFVSAIFLLTHILMLCGILFLCLINQENDIRKSILKLKRLGLSFKNILLSKTMLNISTLLGVILTPLFLMFFFNSSKLVFVVNTLIALITTLLMLVLDCLSYRGVKYKKS